ncbi:DUF6712 family protein [Chryseobacterium terrae]|uniref:DUF6712 family protein n=1 Tax=Chryseobacterium terrae TaxID=3163299 RepID=A0ABW8Y6K8_9FLAO
MQNNTITKEEYKKYIGLSEDFAFNKLKPYEDSSFRKKIYPYFSDEFISDLKINQISIFELIKKAAACYALVASLPFIKVKISSFGLDKYQQEKMKSAEWYDIRDLGLSLIKIADEAISDAITEIGENPELKSQCDFYKNISFNPIPTPQEFDEIYSINKSMDTYIALTKLMKRVWLNSITIQVKDCTIDQIFLNDDLKFLMKDAIVYYSLSLALKLSQFTFVTSGVVIQYEELPWQKSLILSSEDKCKLEEEFSKIAAEGIENIIKHLKNNPGEFPCYEPITITSGREIIERKSGLYI